MKSIRAVQTPISKITLVWTLICTWIAVAFYYNYLEHSSISHQDRISDQDRNYGDLQCAKHKLRPKQSKGTRKKNPRFDIGLEPKGDPTLIKNATLIDGDGSIEYGIDILLEKGLIIRVGSISTSDIQANWNVIQLQGQIVTPGIVHIFNRLTCTPIVG